MDFLKLQHGFVKILTRVHKHLESALQVQVQL